MRLGPRLPAAAIAFAIWLAALAATHPAAAARPSCEIDGIERVVAVGDVHGAYDRFVEILRTTGLIDADAKWMGGHTHLVQLGDVVDRGADSRKAQDLLKRLQDEAEKAGGKVHPLLGNHETMRMLGDLRYVTGGEYEAYVTPDSDGVRQKFLATVRPNEREALMSKTPPGWVELNLAYAPDGEYGSWLRTLDVVVKINDTVFVHGGISPAVAGMSCDKINSQVHKELTGDIEKTKRDPLRSLAAREEGPLWYRGLAQEPDIFEHTVDEVLAKQKADTIVVAHTVTPTGRIVSRFDGKIIEIDTGMQPAYVAGGRASALEIKDGMYTAIYTDRQDVLVDPTR
jgi:hypothetical protein